MGEWDEMLFGPSRSRKRTLGIRDKQILHQRADKKCENCGRRVDFAEMQVGHKTAYAKGGSTQLRNLVCLCYRCNKLQGTDSWATFRKKQGKKPGRTVTTGGSPAARKSSKAGKGASAAKRKTTGRKKRKRHDPWDDLMDMFKI